VIRQSQVSMVVNIKNIICAQHFSVECVGLTKTRPVICILF